MGRSLLWRDQVNGLHASLHHSDPLKLCLQNPWKFCLTNSWSWTYVTINFPLACNEDRINPGQIGGNFVVTNWKDSHSSLSTFSVLVAKGIKGKTFSIPYLRKSWRIKHKTADNSVNPVCYNWDLYQNRSGISTVKTSYWAQGAKGNNSTKHGYQSSGS